MESVQLKEHLVTYTKSYQKRLLLNKKSVKKRYFCSECKYVCFGLADHDIHMRIKHRQGPKKLFICPNCDYYHTKHFSVKLHFKSNHSEDRRQEIDENCD